MSASDRPASPEFSYTDLLPTGEDPTPYRLVTSEGVSTTEVDGRTFLKVDPEALRKLAAEAMHDIRTTCAPSTWPSCAASSTTRRPAPTTGSWRSTC